MRDRAIRHGDGAKDEVAAYIRFAVECEAASFVGKYERIRHRERIVGGKNNKFSNKTQAESFAAAARALECDESEERFDEALKKIGRHKTPIEPPLALKEPEPKKPDK